MKKIICCLATAAVAFGMLSAVGFVKANADTVKPSFSTAKVSLNENIVLKFGIENYTEGYTLTFGYKGETYDGKVDENGEAAFSLVTPQYLGETVTATLKKDGEQDIVKAYSVKEYLDTLVRAENTDEAYKNYSCEKFVAMKTLAVDMLNYGAAAQEKYLAGEDYTLVNADLTNVEKAYATDFAKPDDSVQATLSGTQSGYEWVSAGIRFDYNVSLYFVIKPETAGAKLKLKIGDNEVIDSFIEENGNYKYRYENVNVVDFATAYTVKVLNEAGEEIGQTLTYSVNTYVLNKYQDDKMGAITQAVYNYGVSAKAFETAGDGHAYDHVELLQADGTLAEVIAKPDFERKDVITGGTKDTLDYSLNYSKARFVCACGKTHEEKEVEATLVDETKTFTKNDDSTEVTVNGKTYVADIQVLYARGILSTIEQEGDKVYFVNTFDVKGYKAEDFVLFTEGGEILAKDDVILAVGQITFKTDITTTEFTAKYQPADGGNKPVIGVPYGLGVKIRDKKVNVASGNQNGDVLYATVEDKTIVADNGRIYRTGNYWGKAAVMISNFAVKSVAFAESGEDLLLTINFIDCVSNVDKYRLFAEFADYSVKELSIEGEPIVNKDNYTATITVKILSEDFSLLPAYIHMTLNGGKSDKYSNAYPMSSYGGASIEKDGKYYFAESQQYGLRIVVTDSSTLKVPLTKDNAGDLFRYNSLKGKSGEALEANRVTVKNEKGEVTEKVDYLSYSFVDYILFELYKKDDTTTSCGRFIMRKETIYAGDKTLFFGGYTTETGYTNLYVMLYEEDGETIKTDRRNELNNFFKAALGDNYVAGDYVLSAQIIMKSGSGFDNSDKVLLPTDDAHTFTIS